MLQEYLTSKKITGTYLCLNYCVALLLDWRVSKHVFTWIYEDQTKWSDIIFLICIDDILTRGSQTLAIRRPQYCIIRNYVVYKITSLFLKVFDNHNILLAQRWTEQLHTVNLCCITHSFLHRKACISIAQHICKSASPNEEFLEKNEFHLMMRELL